MTKMYQFDPQSCAACSEIVQQQKFMKIHPRSIGVHKKLKRGIVNPQASAPFGDRVNGCCDER
jgi:hypothetical protein